ncbi:hypothetical protein C8J56DRAFT_835612 [Mycena floridula]|nr:hypothetical protein C8J56DRAFT_835612 [Mycena floridula]
MVPKIKAEIVKSRHDWDKHEPRMWARAHGISDHDLLNFTIKDDLVLVSSASTTYGTIILGKIHLPAVNDTVSKGFIHVRIHDPPNRGTEDVTFHSLFTDERMLMVILRPGSLFRQRTSHSSSSMSKESKLFRNKASMYDTTSY